MATNTTTASGINPPHHRTLNAVLADFLERAGWSAGQVFFATLLAGGTSITVASLPWKYASVLALSAAVVSVVLTAIQYAAKWTNLSFWPDTIVRLAKTFLASLAASFAATHPFDIVTFNWTTALNVAAVAVLAALGKGLLARGSSVVSAADHAATAPATTTSNPSTLPATTYLAAVRR